MEGLRARETRLLPERHGHHGKITGELFQEGPCLGRPRGATEARRLVRRLLPRSQRVAWPGQRLI